MTQESHSDDWLKRQISDFEAAWQQFETPPEIGDFLPPSTTDSAARKRLFIDLVMIDLEHRWRRPSSATATVDPVVADRDRVPQGDTSPTDQFRTVDYQLSSTPGAFPSRPRLEHYVERYPELGSLAELPDHLIICEFRLRNRFGDMPSVDEYREQFGSSRDVLWRQLDEILLETQTAGHAPSSIDVRHAIAPQTHALKIRCPHCHNHVEILDDQTITEITCPSCDSLFSLIGHADMQSRSGSGPRQLGNFELIEQVGAGAFGAVWKARDRELERTVAVKIPRRTQINAEDIEKFVREARAAAQLKHPNIVSVFEVGREQDTVYIVSDFIEGKSLDKWLAEQQLKPTKAAQLCLKIAIALHHAHEAGIVHRDLKPSNIMIDAAGEPHVMDFGLAKREAGEITMTVEGQILGTPAYMSPEQARGEGHAADRRSDVYSLGVILFELLTGERPFRGDLRMLLQQVIEDEAPSPRKLDSRIPKDLETVTLKCLEKEPAKRYRDAQLLADELRRFIEHRPIVARPISRSERAWRWCKRNQVVASLIATVALVLAIGIVATSHFARDASRQARVAYDQRDRADDETRRAKKQEDIARVKSQETLNEKQRADDEAGRAVAEADRARTEEQKASRRLYVSQIERARKAWETGDRPTAWDYLQACRSDLRGWEFDFLHTTFSREKLMRGHMNAVSSVAFSPDGKQIVSGSYDHTLKVWDATNGEEILTLKGHNGYVMSVAFSPDGKRIASGSIDKTVKVWDATNGEETLTWNGHTDRVYSVAFSPDGKRIASGSEDRTLKVWDATSGKTCLTLKGHKYVVNSVAFSPDGKQIVSGSADWTAKVWDATNGEETLTWKGHTGGVRSVAFSPDGKRIVSGSHGNMLKVWDLTSGAEIMSSTGHVFGVSGVAFSPDGKQIVSGSDQTLMVQDATTGEVTLILKGHTEPVISVAFSPDGKRIVSGSEDNTLKVWDAMSGEEATTLEGHARLVLSVAFSPDGKRIASGSEDGELKVWDATSGAETMVLPGNVVGVHSVAFSPDGKWIVGGSYFDAKVWDASNGVETLTLKGHTRHVVGVAFSPDGKRIASGSDDGELKVWDATSGADTMMLPGHVAGVLSVAFSPDGKWIVSGSKDQTLKIWDAMSGQETLTLKGHTGVVTSVAFSPDGKRIVSGSQDQTLKVWDAMSGEETLTLKGHTGIIYSVAFSPDGKRIVSGSQDQTLKIWDAPTGEETLTLKGHTGEVYSVAFSFEGNRIVSGSEDRTVKIWDATLPRAGACDTGGAFIQ